METNLDISFYQSMLQPIVTFFTALVVSGAATTAAVQILKLDIFGSIAKTYPRLTNAVVSFLASLVAIYNSNLQLVVSDPWQILAFAVGVFVVSAITYNNVVKTNKDSTTNL